MGTTRYTVIDGEILSEDRNGVKRDYVPDPQGNTLALLNNTQTITDTFSHYPYGEVASRTGTTQTPFQYGGSAGYYQDNSGRTYVRARHLRAAHGRWMTQDPIGFGGGDFNLYRYVDNNPVNATDASGLKPNCTPVAYVCFRDLAPLPAHHAFFWIHYPCEPKNDQYFGYGPGGYSEQGEIKDDREGVENGRVNCHRSDCDVSCVVKLGAMIGYYIGDWTLDKYVPHFHDCKTFLDQVLEYCDCSYRFKGFFPSPHLKPKKK